MNDNSFLIDESIIIDKKQKFSLIDWWLWMDIWNFRIRITKLPFRIVSMKKIHNSLSISIFSFPRHTSNIQKRNTNSCLWVHSLFQQRIGTAISFSSIIIRGIPKICFLPINYFLLVITPKNVTQGSWLIYVLLCTKIFNMKNFIIEK